MAESEKTCKSSLIEPFRKQSADCTGCSFIDVIRMLDSNEGDPFKCVTNTDGLRIDALDLPENLPMLWLVTTSVMILFLFNE